jgi:hypothetical protein
VIVGTIGGVPITELVGGALFWSAGLAIDCDGAPTAYAPKDSGLITLDDLRSAGRPGDWWALATKNGLLSSEPVIQGDDDLAPGYYVSMTALCDGRFARTDPRRYVDASTVPYVSVPPELIALGARVGQLAAVVGPGGHSPAIIADVGPKGRIGEGSPALARVIGVDDDGRTGGCSSGVACLLFVGSRTVPAWPRADMGARVQELIEIVGGWNVLRAASQRRKSVGPS